MKLQGNDGNCRYCGANLVDWHRTRKCNVNDLDYTFKSLNTELWRHSYWHIEIDEKAIKYAKKLGRTKLAERIKKRIESSVGNPANAWDGRQTPREGNPIYYAQHATAICCRKCIEQWHGISRNLPLTIKQIDYFTELINRYLLIRLPDLKD
jgi:hypothetical protein